MKISSEHEARELIEKKVLPETTVRRTCLTVFADAIAEANIHGRDKWAIACTASKVRLHVGHIIVCTLKTVPNMPLYGWPWTSDSWIPQALNRSWKGRAIGNGTKVKTASIARFLQGTDSICRRRDVRGFGLT